MLPFLYASRDIFPDLLRYSMSFYSQITYEHSRLDMLNNSNNNNNNQKSRQYTKYSNALFLDNILIKLRLTLYKVNDTFIHVYTNYQVYAKYY